LHAVIDETERKNLEIKTDLKKLEATKKEKDAKVLMDTIYNQLDDHMPNGRGDNCSPSLLV
jgi:hypothetical protein